MIVSLTTVLALALAPLAHLVGDYPLQSHTMAIYKTVMWRWAFIHAATGR